MAFSDSIISFINESLKDSSLNNKVFQTGAYHGMTSIVARKKTNGQLEILPATVDLNGEYKPVEPNDKHSIVIYHKTISSNYQFLKNDSYGDNYSVKSTTDIAMIIWADNKKLKLSAEEVEARIIIGLPQTISEAKRLQLKIRSALITPISTDMDKLRVFRQEYQNVEFFLKPNHTLFQLRYRAELVYDRKCLAECGCGPQ